MRPCAPIPRIPPRSPRRSSARSPSASGSSRSASSTRDASRGAPSARPSSAGTRRRRLMRGDQEIVVVVRREGEFLVMRRAPERLGYWSLVAGGLEPERDARGTRRSRELREETGLEAEVAQAADLALVLAARRPAGDPGALRAGHRDASPSTRSSRTPRRAGSRSSTPSTTSTAGATSTRRARPHEATRRLATRCAPGAAAP